MTEGIKFTFWRSCPKTVRKTIGSAEVMARLIELADKGLRAHVKNTVMDFAAREGMGKHIADSFRIVDSQIRFACSEELGRALQKAYPRLNFKPEPNVTSKTNTQECQKRSVQCEMPLLSTISECTGAA